MASSAAGCWLLFVDWSGWPVFSDPGVDFGGQPDRGASQALVRLRKSGPAHDLLHPLSGHAELLGQLCRPIHLPGACHRFTVGKGLCCQMALAN